MNVSTTNMWGSVDADEDTHLFVVTAGRGTEKFAAEEINKKMTPVWMSTRDGKVLFKHHHITGSHLSMILSLKSVERAFAVIADYDNSTFIQTKRTFLDQLMSVLSAQNNFKRVKLVLQQLSSLSHHQSQYQCSQKSETCKESSLTATAIPPARHPADDYDANECKNPGVAKHEAGKEDSQKCDAASEEQKISCSDPSEPPQKLPRLEIPMTNCDVSIREHVSAVSTMPELQKCEACSQHDGYERMPGSLSHKSIIELDDKVPITFRISIKCSGKVRKWIDVKRLARDLAWRVAKATGWVVNLKHPQVEVCVHISDEYVTAGIPLTRHPLSRRSYMMDPGLRAPVAWIMCQLANIQPGDMVLDPLCGKGTILIEACSDVKTAVYLGGDKDPSQTDAALQNVNSSGLPGMLSLLQADGLCMPLRDGIVDVVLCDAPFNQKHVTSECPSQFYHRLLQEIYRVLRPQGRCVLLTSLEMKPMVLSMVEVTSLQQGQSVDSAAQTPEDNGKETVACVSTWQKEPRNAAHETLTNLMTSKDSAGEIQSKEQTQEAAVERPIDLRTSEVTVNQTLSLEEQFEGNTCEDPALVNKAQGSYKTRVPLQFKSSHYMKLGETHACIIVLNKS